MLTPRLGLFSLCLLAGCLRAPDPSAFADAPTNVATAPPPTSVSMATPETWTAIEIDQSFYLAKWDLPQGGRATVSFLGPSFDAGTISLNIDRWLGQWTVPGSTPEESREFGVNQVDDVGMYQLVLQGTLQSTAQVGGGEPRENWMLVCGIMIDDFGPVYLKVVGPAEDLETQVDEIFANFAKATFSS
ncbi:MAG: hypothetical protein QGF46_00265 [Planctomycetota bacterium]|jgi:hypothetical protein|nr:hypothetical protein [Planctomycetota bacterium]